MKVEPVARTVYLPELSADPQVPVVPEAEPSRTDAPNALLPAFNGNPGVYMTPNVTVRSQDTLVADKGQRSARPPRLGQLPSSRVPPDHKAHPAVSHDPVHAQTSVPQPVATQKSPAQQRPVQPARSSAAAAVSAAVSAVAAALAKQNAATANRNTASGDASGSQVTGGVVVPKPTSERPPSASPKPPQAQATPSPQTRATPASAAMSTSVATTSSPAAVPQRPPHRASTGPPQPLPKAVPQKPQVEQAGALPQPPIVLLPATFQASQQPGVPKVAKHPGDLGSLYASIRPLQLCRPIQTPENASGQPQMLRPFGAFSQQHIAEFRKSALGRETLRALEAAARGALKPQAPDPPADAAKDGPAKGGHNDIMVIMARCCICRGVFPLEEFLNLQTGKVSDKGDKVQRKCLPCQQLLAFVKEASWGTEEKVCDMLKRGNLQQHVRTLPWKEIGPITTRYNPHHVFTYPGVGCFLLPISSRSQNTGVFSTAADAAEGLAPLQPASAAAAKTPVPTPPTAPAGAQAGAHATASPQAAATTQVTAVTAQAATSATATAKAQATPPAAAPGAAPGTAPALQAAAAHGAEGGSNQNAAGAAAGSPRTTSAFPAVRTAVESFAAKLSGVSAVHAAVPSSTSAAPTTVNTTTPTKGAEQSDLQATTSTPERSGGGQQKRKREASVPAPQATPSPAAQQPTKATPASSTPTNAVKKSAAGTTGTGVSPSTAKPPRSTGKQTRSQAKKAAVAQSGENEQVQAKPVPAPTASQPSPKAARTTHTTPSALHLQTPKGSHAGRSQPGMVKRHADVLGQKPAYLSPVQQQSSKAHTPGHSAAAGGAGGTPAAVSLPMHHSHVAKAQGASAPASAVRADIVRGSAPLPASSARTEAAGAVGAGIEAAGAARQIAAGPHVSGEQLGGPQPCSGQRHDPQVKPCAVPVGTSAGHGAVGAESVGGHARTQEHAPDLGVSGTDQVAQATSQQAVAGTQQTMEGLTSAILDGHLASMKLCQSARRRAVQQGLTPAEQRFAALAKEHLKKLNALLEHVF